MEICKLCGAEIRRAKKPFPDTTYRNGVVMWDVRGWTVGLTMKAYQGAVKYTECECPPWYETAGVTVNYIAKYAMEVTPESRPLPKYAIVDEVGRIWSLGNNIAAMWEEAEKATAHRAERHYPPQTKGEYFGAANIGPLPMHIKTLQPNGVQYAIEDYVA